MTIRSELNMEITTFVNVTGGLVTVISKVATGDPSFIRRFLLGANATIATVETLRRYMAAHWPDGHEMPWTLTPYLPPQEAAE